MMTAELTGVSQELVPKKPEFWNKPKRTIFLAFFPEFCDI
jgi:hypothetical protein